MKFASAAIAALAVFSLTACGGSSDTDEPAASSDAVVAEKPAKEDKSAKAAKPGGVLVDAPYYSFNAPKGWIDLSNVSGNQDAERAYSSVKTREVLVVVRKKSPIKNVDLNKPAIAKAVQKRVASNLNLTFKGKRKLGSETSLEFAIPSGQLPQGHSGYFVIAAHEKDLIVMTVTGLTPARAASNAKVAIDSWTWK